MEYEWNFKEDIKAICNKIFTEDVGVHINGNFIHLSKYSTHAFELYLRCYRINNYN